MAIYQPNASGIRALAQGPEVRAALRAVATKGEAFAVTEAQGFRDSGEYASSFHVSDVTVVLRRGPRAGARLENTSGHAAAVEWGNAHSHRTHRVLGRTLAYLQQAP